MDWQKSHPSISEVPLLSDADGTVARMYRLFSEEEDNCFPGKIVVDRDRRVVSQDICDLNVAGNLEEQLRHVQASNAILEAKKQETVLTACTPASWEMGHQVQYYNFVAGCDFELEEVTESAPKTTKPAAKESAPTTTKPQSVIHI